MPLRLAREDLCTNKPDQSVELQPDVPPRIGGTIEPATRVHCGYMSKTFGLKFQSRVLRCFPFSESSSWIVATTSLREENEVELPSPYPPRTVRHSVVKIRVVEFDDKSESLTSPVSYVHPNEVWDLAVSPHAADSLLTVHNAGTRFGVTLWSIDQNGQLPKQCDLFESENRIQRTLWHRNGHVLTLEDTKIRTWDLQEGSPTELTCGQGQDLDQFSNLHISNRDPHTLYIANGQGYQVWDMREMKKEQTVEYCHDLKLRSLDTVQDSIATCGDDGSVKLWDIRSVMQLNGHAHWVWDCGFNQKHPSLLLSVSSDASVILWNVQSPEAVTSPTSVMSEDKKVCSYTDHDESVYCVSWSHQDDWTFASLSYDGRIAINKVPSDIKYRILI